MDRRKNLAAWDMQICHGITKLNTLAKTALRVDVAKMSRASQWLTPFTEQFIISKKYSL